MKKFVYFLIAFYQNAVSRYLPCSCRFSPSCSVYAREAVDRYGVLRGVLKALLRIIRCHPFSKGGYDPLK